MTSGPVAIPAVALLDFRMKCRKFILSTLRKIAERSPLRFTFVRCASAFSPAAIVADKSASLAR